MMPCRDDVAMQQGMEHPLASASRTLPAGQFIKQTAGHKPGGLRVDTEIYRAEYQCRENNEQNYYLPLHMRNNFHMPDNFTLLLT